MINIAVMGYGTVGSGVVELFKMNADSIKERVGEEIKIKYILDIRDFPQSQYSHLLTKKFEDVLDDKDIRVVAETIGGATIAYEFTKKLLYAKKHVITSNKELVSTHGTELLKIAKENNVNYLFEASVGGGIPIIGPLYRCMSANDITEIAGILNGTTNYILTQMIRKGVKFKDALKDAQVKGYAEANSAADVDGIDACRKIAILSSLMCGRNYSPDKVKTLGITEISLEDVKYAEKLNSVIKLIGHSKVINGKVFAKVAPMIVSKDEPLSCVEGVFNAILVKGNAVDDVMFYGKGAGMMPTASAVSADVIDAAKHLDRHIGIIWSESSDELYCDESQIKSEYLIRVKAYDIEKAKENLEDIIKIKSEIDGLYENEFAVITNEICENEIELVVQKINDLEYVEKSSKISMLNL